MKNQYLKTTIYYSFLLSNLIMLFLNIATIQSKVLKIVLIIFPIIFLVLSIYVNPIRILFSTGSWKTQTIEYQNNNDKNLKIEFQMQDIGAFGYNKRKVEVNYYSPLFIITKKINIENVDTNKWKKVDIDVNELGLKY